MHRWHGARPFSPANRAYFWRKKKLTKEGYKIAKLVRFYSISPSELFLLDLDLFEELYQWIEPLESQENLAALKLTDYPYMKKEARAKLHKDLYRQAFPKILRGEAKALTAEEISGMINNGK